ncbi:transferase hexapeptide repeat containing protein [Actinoplanes sp. N902-109]|uniref:transferase hexapeptide repeat containing protein n=1 Tax=Actinoplanes sp. (strain N902-109) TaxID=649831 RepID=UPI0003294683|nr:transferase hexapeptide repeat containing protein [Actinoplanes sp. N902-109]AGL20831.1 transferase hexapeptide repeat containing protein [Actinoplanes sp. N902-109]
MISGKARIGSGATIHPGTCLGEHYGQAPTLGNNVSMAPGAKAYGPIVIGDGATLGANSVVTSHVEAGTTVVGAPARPIGVRTRHVVRGGVPPHST